MKLINAIFGIVITVTVCSIISISVSMNFALSRNLNAARCRKSSLEFVAESFRNCNRGIGFENLNEWQIQCRALCKLDYIAWSNAEDFMNVSYEVTDDPLFYGVWKDSYGKTYEVYSRGKN